MEINELFSAIWNNNNVSDCASASVYEAWLHFAGVARGNQIHSRGVGRNYRANPASLCGLISDFVRTLSRRGSCCSLLQTSPSLRGGFHPLGPRSLFTAVPDLSGRLKGSLPSPIPRSEQSSKLSISCRHSLKCAQNKALNLRCETKRRRWRQRYRS